MGKIGGNTFAVIQIAETIQNEFGNEVNIWVNAFEEPIIGFLDVASEGSSYTLLKRVEDSDYIFLCDYFIPVVNGVKLGAENSRILIDGEIYEVKLYDDPMRLHEHIEIYLKYLGGQS